MYWKGMSMKPSLQFSVPCLDATMEGNNLSFNRVFFDLPSHEFPTPAFDKFYIANGWSMGQGHFNVKMRILDPNGETLEGSTFERDFTLENKYTPFLTLFRLENIVFPMLGQYKVQIFLDNQLHLEYYIELRKI